MALRDPVAVYNAASNLEAHFVRDALIASGVEAFLVEDVSQIGTWVGGHIAEIHKPQVWVERADVERAKPVLDEFERRAAELRQPDALDVSKEVSVEVVCEECGRRSFFPPEKRGSVQECPFCLEYLDVGGEESPEEWPDAEGEEDAERET